MQLAITVLGKKNHFFITDVVSAITTCRCCVLELRSSCFSHNTLAAYLLVAGEWNHLAKLEHLLDNLQKRLSLKIHTLQTEAEPITDQLYIPYRLETIAIEQTDAIEELIIFLLRYPVAIAEAKSSCYPAPYTKTQLLATQFVILIPPTIQILSFREEILDFCDSSNIDAVFEPIRR